MDYQPFKIDSNLLDRMTQVPSKKAVGLDAFAQSFFPQLNNAIDKVGAAYGQRKQRQRQEKSMQDVIQQMMGDQGLQGLLGQIGQPQQPGPPAQQEMPPMQAPPQAQQGPPQSRLQIPPGQPMSAGMSNIGQDVTMQPPPTQAPPVAPPAQGGMPQGKDLSKFLGIYMRADPEGARALIGKMIRERQSQPVFDQLANNPEIPANIKAMIPLFRQNPELAGQIMPSLLKQQKPLAEWAPEAGVRSKNGRTVFYNKYDHSEREGDIPGIATSGSRGGMANVRDMQNLISDLPSKPNAMAAAMVQMSARQGKQMIAAPGAAQRIAMGGLDLARTITRSAPQLDAIQGAGFAENLATRMSALEQKIKADPKGPDAPKIRREMYDIFDEQDKTSRVFIENYFKDIQDIRGDTELPPNWQKIVRRGLGAEIPDIPFQETVDPSKSPGAPAVGGMFNGKKITKVEPM